MRFLPRILKISFKMKTSHGKLVRQHSGKILEQGSEGVRLISSFEQL